MQKSLHQVRLLMNFTGGIEGAQAAKEALDIIASRHQACHTDCRMDNSRTEKNDIVSIEYTAAFTNKRNSIKFSASDLIRNIASYQPAYLVDKKSRDILLLIGAALETMEEFPELPQEMILLPQTSEDRGNISCFVKSQETFDAFANVFAKILSEQKMPTCDNTTARLMRSIGLTGATPT